jgi:hypothetical protein
MKIPASLVAATMASVVMLPAFAHHSAVQFDFTRQVAYKGVVKDFAAINPHMRIVLEVKDAKGTREIRFEGHSTNNMYRNVGDTITVNAAPLRSAEDGGYVVSATTAGGEAFGMRSRSLDAEALRRQAEGKEAPPAP